MKTVNKILLVLAVLLIIAAVIATYTIETESVEVLDEYTTILEKTQTVPFIR